MTATPRAHLPGEAPVNESAAWPTTAESTPTDGPDLSTLVGRVNPDDIDWTDFKDPSGRLSAQIKVLSPTDPTILLVRFEPGQRVDAHSHGSDMLYMPVRGEVDFSDPGERALQPGELRWVRGGHTYGPELGGPNGADVIVISMGGPLSMTWADGE